MWPDDRPSLGFRGPTTRDAIPFQRLQPRVQFGTYRSATFQLE
jgi:hypothetical protein